MPVIRRALSGFADVETSAAAGLARAIRAVACRCWAARRRMEWAAAVAVAAVVLAAAAVWLAAFVAVPAP